jgi:hypothetical protein
MKLDLLTNATVVDDAIRFVSSKDKLKRSSSSNTNEDDDNEESNEPDYGEDKDQLEEEQEEQTGELNEATANHVSKTNCLIQGNNDDDKNQILHEYPTITQHRIHLSVSYNY